MEKLNHFEEFEYLYDVATRIKTIFYGKVADLEQEATELMSANAVATRHAATGQQELPTAATQAAVGQSIVANEYYAGMDATYGAKPVSAGSMTAASVGSPKKRSKRDGG